MTRDNVIRREMEFAEGDPINSDLINDSIKNLKSLGFFKSVNIDEIQNKSIFVLPNVSIAFWTCIYKFS